MIGASRRRGSIGGELFRNVLAADFERRRLPRQPRRRAGRRRARLRHDRRDPRPGRARSHLPALAAGARSGGAGAREGRPRALRDLVGLRRDRARKGVERQERLLALVRAHGARLVGPNCLGIASSAPRLNATFAPRALPPGRIGFSSQSGALGLALLEKASERQLGFSAFVSIGNKADVSSNDLLEWWEDDPETDVVLLYLESFGNPRKFAPARAPCRAAEADPRAEGRDDRRPARGRRARTPPRSPAPRRQSTRSSVRRGCCARARSKSSSTRRRCSRASRCPPGRRVGVLTNAGGLGILCADACEAAGLELPEPTEETRAALARALPGEASLANPIDMLGSATAATYEQVIPPLLADPRLDALIVLFVPPVVAGAEEVAAAICRARRGRGRADKPVLAVVMSAEGTPAALLDERTRSRRSRIPSRRPARSGSRPNAPNGCAGRPAPFPELDGIDARRPRGVVEALARASDVWLDPAQTRALLEAYGVPLVAERVAAERRRGRRRRARAGLPGRRQDRRGRRAQDRDRAASRSTSATRSRFAPRSSGSARPCSFSRTSRAAPSSSRASCRTRSSARSSPSARAACSPS